MKIPDWPVPIGFKPVSLGLERVQQALANLGNPHHKIAPVIHVAGTNGKGSVCAFIRAILESAGLTCNVYTSPNLVEFNERIVTAGNEISDDDLNRILSKVKKKTKDVQLTFFEATTIAAFEAFSEVEADYTILETGMGGRLDATNVMGLEGAPNPALTVITPVSMDHMEYLGESIEKIAHEKACISKKGVPLVLGKQEEKAQSAIEDYASKRASQIFHFNKDYLFKSYENGFMFNHSGFSTEIDNISLNGQYQKENAATAIMSVLALKDKRINFKHIREGVANAVWKGRLQNIKTSKLGSYLDENDEIYIDCGHNPSAAEALAKFIESLDNSENNKTKKNFLILGMLWNKDIAGYVNLVKHCFEKIYAFEIPDQESSAKLNHLTDILQQSNTNFSQCLDLEETIKQIKEQNQECRIFIAGSLYLAGYVLAKY